MIGLRGQQSAGFSFSVSWKENKSVKGIYNNKKLFWRLNSWAPYTFYRRRFEKCRQLSCFRLHFGCDLLMRLEETLINSFVSHKSDGTFPTGWGILSQLDLIQTNIINRRGKRNQADRHRVRPSFNLKYIILLWVCAAARLALHVLKTTSYFLVICFHSSHVHLEATSFRSFRRLLILAPHKVSGRRKEKEAKQTDKGRLLLLCAGRLSDCVTLVDPSCCSPRRVALQNNSNTYTKRIRYDWWKSKLGAYKLLSESRRIGGGSVACHLAENATRIWRRKKKSHLVESAASLKLTLSPLPFLISSQVGPFKVALR